MTINIYFEESGGFTGLIKQSTLNLDNLPDDYKDIVLKLLKDKAQPPTSSNSRDGINYELRIKQDEVCQTKTYSSLDVPNYLWPLLNYLSQNAKPLGFS